MMMVVVVVVVVMVLWCCIQSCALTAVDDHVQALAMEKVETERVFNFLDNKATVRPSGGIIHIPLHARSFSCDDDGDSAQEDCRYDHGDLDGDSDKR
jgi:hypothetical protein